MSAEPQPPARVLSVVIDCADPLRLAGFWRGLLGGHVDPRNATDEWVSLAEVPVLGYLSFQRVPETKGTKNRLHLDLDTAELDGSVQSACRAGAVKVGAPVEEASNWFQVMQDPEGNEFCFILRKNRVS